MAIDMIEAHEVVTRAEWLPAREALLQSEKELTRARDRVSAERRSLPWVRVDKEYTFQTTQGLKTMTALFHSRSQLIVYHFMWRKELGEGCVGCSFLCDHLDGPNQHLAQHDVSVVVVSRAPLAELQAFRQRMGWKFEWVSSAGSDFNFDYHVSFRPEELASGEVYYNYRNTQASIEELSGISVFFKDASGDIFHTYSSYGRGSEEVLGAYMYLDLTPKGRNENGPHFSLGDWVRHHDRYDAGGHVDSTGGYIAAKPLCCSSTESDRKDDPLKTMENVR
jgi:predicted dithiol-disulfide oxidoreductase (DUF899 family)